MTAEKRKELLDSTAHELFEISKKIESLIPELVLDIVQNAARRIITDLLRAVENCTVIGLHQIGEALDDKMGAE